MCQGFAQRHGTERDSGKLFSSSPGKLIHLLYHWAESAAANPTAEVWFYRSRKQAGFPTACRLRPKRSCTFSSVPAPTPQSSVLFPFRRLAERTCKCPGCPVGSSGAGAVRLRSRAPCPPVLVPWLQCQEEARTHPPHCPVGEKKQVRFLIFSTGPCLYGKHGT